MNNLSFESKATARVTDASYWPANVRRPFYARRYPEPTRLKSRRRCDARISDATFISLGIDSGEELFWLNCMHKIRLLVTESSSRQKKSRS